MRDDLANLRDEMLVEERFPEGEDETLILWQLLHFLNDRSVRTRYQDYIFHVYGHP